MAGHDAMLRPLTTRPDRLRIVRAEHTLAALDALHTRVREHRQVLQSEGVSILGITTDMINNRVTVGVGSDPKQAEAALQRRFPREPLVVESMTSVEPDTKQHTDAPPLRGGQYLFTPSDQVGYVKVCTSAFVADKATRTDAGIWLHQYYLLTAGHCGFGLGSVSWMQNTFPIGAADLTSYSQNGTSNVDGQRLPIGETVKSNQVYVRPTTPRTYQSITTQQYTWQDAPGDPVCTAGFMTEYACGTISSLNNTVTFSLGNMTFTNQRFATYASQGGDSGSGAFNGSLAMGIHSGRASWSDGTSKAIYSHVGYAIQTLQLSNVNVS